MIVRGNIAPLNLSGGGVDTGYSVSNTSWIRGLQNKNLDLFGKYKNLHYLCNMKKFYKKEEYVYRNLHLSMSTKAMADVLYAGIETDAAFTILWNMNRGEYSRKQNSRNGAVIKVFIHPEQIELFEELSNHKLKIQESIGIN